MKIEDVSIVEVAVSNNTIEVINIDEVSSNNEIEVISVDTITVQQPAKRTRLCPSFLQIYPTLTDKDSKGTGRFILKNIFRIVS